MKDYTKLVEALRICHVVDCDDCVLKKECVESIIKGERPYVLLHNDAADAIEALQAQLPKRGEWVEENRRPRSSQFVCSECHRTAYDPQPTRDKAWRKRCRYAYCPNCGAKMTEVQDGK